MVYYVGQKEAGPLEKIALITGASRGIGRETALLLWRKGCRVAVNYCRSSEAAFALADELCRLRPGSAAAFQADVSSKEQVDVMMDSIRSAFGDPDILVNNAGFGISGAIEFTSTADAKSLFDVNFFGMVNMNRAVIPIMRQAGRGRIVNLSSVAAPVPIPFQAYYSATKASVNAYAMALANELRPFGITVCAVMPGDIHTGFTAARRKVSEGDDIYGGRISRSVARMEHDEQTGMDPAKAGAYIAKVALRERSHHPLYAIRADYKFFVFLSKILPAQALNRLIYAIYAK